MKSTSIKKAISIAEFSEREIKNPEFIIGGKKGPIDRDKVRRRVQKE